MYKFEGMVVEIPAVQTFVSGFAKRELVVRQKSDHPWPQDITFNFKKEQIAKLDAIKVGDRVAVTFVLDGRQWTDPATKKVRHFSDLVGIGVECLARPAAAETPAPSVNEEDYPF